MVKGKYKMTKAIHITIADVVYKQIEETKPEGIGRSEYVEELIREGLQKKEGEKNEEDTNIRDQTDHIDVVGDILKPIFDNTRGMDKGKL